MPDSNGSRGIGSQCSVPVRSAMTASAWPMPMLRALAAVAIMGRPRPHLAARLVERRHRGALGGARADPAAGQDGADFRSAVALYPGCRRLSNAAWSARVPTLILIGRADDQASAATCQQMVAGARGRSARLEIHVYPGAHHDFDHPNRPLQLRTGLAFSVDGTGRVHSGTNHRPRRRAQARAGVG
jgi:pimeloyl-ACP methyl ester carboxylesterase